MSGENYGAFATATLTSTPPSRTPDSANIDVPLQSGLRSTTADINWNFDAWSDWWNPGREIADIRVTVCNDYGGGWHCGSPSIVG